MASESEREKRETHEAVDDVIESMERFASRHWMHDEGQNVREFAARLKAAWKREREVLHEAATEKMLEGATIIDNRGHGNAAAMREALIEIEKMAHIDLGNVYPKYRNKFNNLVGGIERIARAALSTPPRKCDVGTAEEQAERHKAFCRKHFTPDQLGGNCRKCPLKDRRGWSCQLAWAQTPYEAEEGEDNG